MWYRTKFQVIPIMAGRFPIDMLRYDACHPDTEQDSARIISTYPPMIPGDVPPITLEKIHNGRKHHLTDERWRSFGWAIVPPSVHTVITHS